MSDERRDMRILFVCLGNICRSPLAEAIARDYTEKKGLNIKVDSAGTGDWHIGEPPCGHSQAVAKLHGLDISAYKGRQVCTSDFDEFDIVVGLDSKNIANLKSMGCEKVQLLGDFGLSGEDVPDPYFFPGFEGFEKVFSMIEKCTINLIERIKA